MPTYTRKPNTATKTARKRAVDRTKYTSKAQYQPRYSGTSGFNSKSLPDSNAIVSNTKATIQRGYLPLGREYMARLPYVENFPIIANGTTGLSATGFIFVSNSVYDPRYDLGGHQPLQYDFMAAAYERVWVHGCQVTLTFSNPDADGMWVGYRCRTNTNTVSTVSKTLEYIQEMRDSVIAPINNTGSQTKTFTFYVPNAKLFGISKQQYCNLEYSHATNGGPQAFGLIEPYAISTIGDGNHTVRCNIKITYYCQFTNPITQPQS